ncbi:uncharacterized protein FOMMEDRAFT_16925 [Fomitiporia mediterranea MF3/22]|uniref:uncharacterized protein n=1 Tax=Fomitiporia mediterranea (strain MF3/22) TaxID=694068 RepID=UPI00044094F2|nr:uncharacterized protein FOMMEDRAFT_16925 [Fomitiporia mediterranea MF3/22]EJD06307.1 hypothetical protein FOMMEDRAFT_16925 [Fomitiporia mediterranea MF3/22]
MSLASISSLSPIRDFVANLLRGDASRSIVPFIPRPLRLLFLIVLILNCRSLPFVWHLRVFRPVLYIRLKRWFLSFSSKKTQEAWFDSLCPIGRSPFELKSVYTTWASLDESDYNIHLSNSSYAKVLDMLRLKYALSHMVTVFRDGCWLALGATSLRFMREIPMGTKYEVRMYFGSWDSKWIYAIARFVSKKKPSSNNPVSSERLKGADQLLQLSSSSANLTTVPFPQLHTPNGGESDVSGTTTPNPTLIASIAELKSLWSEAPDETLHCVAMNEICVKRGRLTVPPALAIAAAGCGVSHDRWEALKKLRKGKGMKELLEGGWKNVPEGERWWDEALHEFEGERVKRLSILKGIREGLESTKLL